MFVLSVNLPLKTNEFLPLKYKDLFDEYDNPKGIELKLGRFQKDETILIPLRMNVKNVLLSYANKYKLSYKNNAEEELFQSRKHQVVSLISWGRIISNTAEAVGITKNVAAESIRKTYGKNIYDNAPNKLNALLFLGEIWGQQREAKIIKYLGLADDTIDFDYYLGETFSLGNVDLSKINCLKNS